MELRTNARAIEAATINHVRSSFYKDRSVFPNGSIRLDSAFVMRNLDVGWHRVDTIRAAVRP